MLHIRRLFKIIFALVTITATSSGSTHSLNQNRSTLYFGFFFDETTAESIKLATDSYFNSSVEGIPEFSSFLQNISSKAGLSSIFDYFVKPLDPNTGAYDPLYHVTAKFCGKDQVACDEYAEKNAAFINQTFEMHLTGYVITNRTFGIRVNLTAQQQALFDNNESRALARNGRSVELTYYPQHSYSSSLPGIRLETMEPFPPSLPVTNTRAHSTLGCAPGIHAVTTGPDVLQAIAFEERSGEEPNVVVSWDNITDPLDPEGRNMRVSLYKSNSSAPEEENIFVVYPRVKLVANATLMHYFTKARRPSSSTPIRRHNNYYSYSLRRYNSTVTVITSVMINWFQK